MGVELASHIVAGLLLGMLLDYWLNTGPVLLIAGTIAGVVVGMAEFIRTALKAQKQYMRKDPPAAEKDEPKGGKDDHG